MKSISSTTIFSLIAALILVGCSIGNPPSPAPGKALLLDSVDETPAGSEDYKLLVINEVQIGTSSGTTDDNEFIEIYNPSDSTVSLDDIRIYRGTAASDPTLLCNFSTATHFNGGTVPANTSIVSHGYYLVVNDNADSSFANIADAKVLDSRMILASNNKIYLTFAGTPTTASNIIDMVGYGTADAYEGSAAAPEIATDQSIQRKNIAQDTNENSTDFEVLITPTPKSTASETPAAPTASGVSISGSTVIGSTLTGNYTYSDINGDSEGTSTFRWLKDDVPIAGATLQTYLVLAGDLGSYIKFEVTPVATVVPTIGTAVQSSAAGPVTSTPPPVTHLVVNEVQIGTTSGGVDDEFIEIYNPTGSAIDLSGYRLYRATAAGTPALLCNFSTTTHFTGSVLPSNTIVPSHGYYLIINDNASASLKASADAQILDARMVLTASNVIYLSTDTVSNATDPDIVDFVGYGTTANHEGASAAPEITTDNSIQRKATGQDTDDNGTDFEVLATPTPTNSGL